MNIVQACAEPGTTLISVTDNAGGSTSNMLLPKLGPAVLPAFLSLGLLTGGTSLPVHPDLPPMSASIFPISASSPTESAATVQEQSEAFLPELAKSVRSLHRRSGLTWEELANVFGVSRRTLHNWSTGGQVSASNAQTIALVVNAIHQIDAGNPKLTRSRLLAPAEDGSTIYTRLARLHGPTPMVSGPTYRPDELLSTRQDSPDPTGKLVDFEELL